MGTYTGLTIPTNSGYQDYLNDLDYTNNTGYTTTGFTYLAIGKSRISEKKLVFLAQTIKTNYESTRRLDQSRIY